MTGDARVACRVLAAVCGSAVVLAAIGAGAGEARAGDDAEAILAKAREGGDRDAAFTGVIETQWRDADQVFTDQVSAAVVAGSVELAPGSVVAVLGFGDRRWVGAPGAWTPLWGAHDARKAPDPSDHWVLRRAGTRAVAGRVAIVILAVDPDTGVARARFYVDREMGVLLRREVLDRHGAPLRSVGFVAFAPLGEPPLDSGSPGVGPVPYEQSAPRKLANLPDGYLGPEAAGSAFQLLGRYRHADGALQLYYGDGIFTLSLFEQRGSLDWDSIPPGETSRIEGVRTRTYVAPTAHVVVWAADGLVITCVSDAPPDEVHRVVGDLLADDDSWVDDVADFVLGPFGWN